MDRLTILEETLKTWQSYKKHCNEIGYKPYNIDVSFKIKSTKEKIKNLKDSINENIG